MSREQVAKRVLLLIVCMLLFGLGWFLPAFYDWSGVDQSHSTPAFDRAVQAFIGCVVLAWIAIPWLPMRPDEPADQEKKPFQFDLRTLLLVTGAVAVSIAGMISVPSVFAIFMWLVVFVSSARIILLFLSRRWQLVLLLACMYLPYSWVVSGEFIDEVNLKLVFGAVGLPAFLPSLLLGSLFIKHVQDSFWLFALLTGVELAIGCWVMTLGPKRMLAYLLLVVAASVYGSLVLNALMRM